MRAIRKLADHVIDTSEMTVHELRHVFTASPAARRVAAGRDDLELRVQARHPGRLGFVVRREVLPNPHFVLAAAVYRPGSEVVRYLDRASATHEFLDHTLNLLKFLDSAIRPRGKRI
jgi:RNase adaptor protein for sRNA GlmZ degradation